METDAPRYARRMTSGAEPGAVKAASPVLNGEDEETGRKALRLVLTQRRGGSNQTRHVCRNCPTRWSLITRLRLKSPPAGRFVQDLKTCKPWTTPSGPVRKPLEKHERHSSTRYGRSGRQAAT